MEELLPTDPKVREAIMHPMRMRELGLEIAKASVKELDGIIGAVRHLGPLWTEWTQRIEAVKSCVVEQLEKKAELQYRVLILEEALRIMERHPSMKAEDAIAVIESTMLELATAPNS